MKPLTNSDIAFQIHSIQTMLKNLEKRICRVEMRLNGIEPIVNEDHITINIDEPFMDL